MEKTKHSFWNEIFNNFGILKIIKNAGFFDITATQIKQLTGQEPRLMAKLDFESSLPEVMRENGLSMLAIENGVYRIAKTNPFIKVPKISGTEIVKKMPTGYLTLDPFDINSESGALDISSISGILDTVFGEATDLTIRGRLRKGANFRFKLGDVEYPVNGVQIEVDGGYEGEKSINLIEAKIGSLNTISLRQLLYPELAWKNTINDKKKVQSYLFVYEEPFFRFLPFRSENGIYSFDSSQEKIFKFRDGKSYDIYEIQKSSSPKMDFSAPLPQADDFDKVLIMLRKIAFSGGGISREDLILEMLNHGLEAERQFNYYHSCLKLLRLSPAVEHGMVTLTKFGEEIATLSSKEQAYELAKILFSEETFHTALHSGVDAIPDEIFINKWGVSGSTIPRRKSTIKNWVSWFKNVLIDD